MTLLFLNFGEKFMRKMVYALAAAVVGLGSVSQVKADEVILNDGEILNGTVLNVDSGKMSFHSSVVGDVTIPMSHVRTFSTDKPIDIHLADGTVIERQVETSTPGEVALAGNGLVAPQKFMLSDIDQINPPLFSGSFRLGGTLTRGNTDTDTLAAGFNLHLKVKKDSLDFVGEYDYGDQKSGTPVVKTTTVDHWDLDAKYDHFFTAKFYGYVDGEVAKDRIAFLDLRFVPSAGVGYQWFNTSPFKFATEGGIAWLYENFTNGTPNVEEVAAKFAYHLTYEFNDKVSAFNDVTYIPSLTQGSRYLLLTDLGLHAKISAKLFIELRAEWDFNSSPANNALKNDTRYIASVGYTL
jgi:putative salt-induced outer membrane protein YdiY